MTGPKSESLQGFGREIAASTATLTRMAQILEKLAVQGDSQQIVPTSATDPIREAAAGIRAVIGIVESAHSAYMTDHEADRRREDDPIKGPVVTKRADVTAAMRDS